MLRICKLFDTDFLGSEVLRYPVVTVAVPLGLHYWATHPELASDMGEAVKRLRGRLQPEAEAAPPP